MSSALEPFLTITRLHTLLLLKGIFLPFPLKYRRIPPFHGRSKIDPEFTLFKRNQHQNSAHSNEIFLKIELVSKILKRTKINGHMQAELPFFGTFRRK